MHDFVVAFDFPHEIGPFGADHMFGEGKGFIEAVHGLMGVPRLGKLGVGTLSEA